MISGNTESNSDFFDYENIHASSDWTHWNMHESSSIIMSESDDSNEHNDTSDGTNWQGDNEFEENNMELNERLEALAKHRRARVAKQMWAETELATEKTKTVL